MFCPKSVSMQFRSFKTGNLQKIDIEVLDLEVGPKPDLKETHINFEAENRQGSEALEIVCLVINEQNGLLTHVHNNTRKAGIFLSNARYG